MDFNSTFIIALAIIAVGFWVNYVRGKRDDRLHEIMRDVMTAFALVETPEEFEHARWFMEQYKMELKTMGFEYERYYWDLDVMRDRTFDRLMGDD